jgi:hypothetical protein
MTDDSEAQSQPHDDHEQPVELNANNKEATSNHISDDQVIQSRTGTQTQASQVP